MPVVRPSWKGNADLRCEQVLGKRLKLTRDFDGRDVARIEAEEIERGALKARFEPLENGRQFGVIQRVHESVVSLRMPNREFVGVTPEDEQGVVFVVGWIMLRVLERPCDEVTERLSLERPRSVGDIR